MMAHDVVEPPKSDATEVPPATDAAGVIFKPKNSGGCCRERCGSNSSDDVGRLNAYKQKRLKMFSNAKSGRYFT